MPRPDLWQPIRRWRTTAWCRTSTWAAGRLCGIIEVEPDATNPEDRTVERIETLFTLRFTADLPAAPDRIGYVEARLRTLAGDARR